MGVTGDIISAGTSVIGSTIGMLHAAHQKKVAAKLLANLHRPTYNIPGSQNAALNMAQSRYDDQSMPGEAGLKNQLSANTASGLTAAQQAAGSSGDILDAVTKLYNNQNQGNINLGIQSAQMHNQNASNLQNELGNQAQYEDKAWNYNVDSPYQQQLSHALALQGAGEQGMNNSINSFGKSAAAAATLYKPATPQASPATIAPMAAYTPAENASNFTGVDSPYMRQS